MKISRDKVISIIKYLDKNNDFYFPFKIMCKGYGTDQILYEDNDYVEIVIKDDFENLLNDNSYDDFELWEDLRNLNKETIELMSKGFIDKIIKENSIDKISTLAKKYRKEWKIDLCKSENIEEYGVNEFIGGKAEAFEECLKILNDT
jgi:hypothetical protein